MQRGSPIFAFLAFVILFLATAPAARSQGLATAGIPASAKGVFFVDAAPDAPFGAALRAILLRNAPPHAAQVADLGFAPTRDIRGVVIAALPPESPAAGPRGILLLRGSFNTTDILAAAEKKAAKPVEIGGRKFVDAGFLAAVPDLGGRRGGAGAKLLLGAATAKILVLADADGAGESIAAFDSAEKAWRAPAALEKLRDSVGTPLLLGSIERGLFPQMVASDDAANGEAQPPSAVRLILAEEGGFLRLRAEADFSSPDDARRAGAQIKTLLDLWVLSLTQKQKPAPAQPAVGASSNSAVIAAPPEDRETPAERLRLERIQRLHEATQIYLEGRALRLTVKYPVPDALLLLRELAAQK